MRRKLLADIAVNHNARIVTSFDYPSIPIRQFDWSAVDDRTYDGADDSSCPVGHGATEREAINGLLDRICMNKGTDMDGIGCAYCSAEMGEQCRATIA